MNKKTYKVKLNLTLSREAKFKAKVMAEQMQMSTSEFIEGLIYGVQIIPGKGKNENN